MRSTTVPRPSSRSHSSRGPPDSLLSGRAAWILRERRPSALAIIGFAWAVGLVAGGWSGNALGLPLTETPMGWAQDHAWDGLVTGLVWGTATAVIGLPDSLRRTRPAPSSPSIVPE